MPFQLLVNAMQKVQPAKTVEDVTRRLHIKKHCDWLAYYYQGCDDVGDMPDQFLVTAQDAICDDPRGFMRRFNRAFHTKDYDLCVLMLITTTIWTYCETYITQQHVQDFFKSTGKFAEYCESIVE
jgi:hypothetical protein